MGDSLTSIHPISATIPYGITSDNNYIYTQANSSTSTLTSGFYAYNYDYYVQEAIEKLPIIIQIKSFKKENNFLNIKYDIILEKFLPDSGTLYIYDSNIYGVFDKDDDCYWYKKLRLNCNSDDLNKIIVNKSKLKYAILLNDYDKKLSNEEIESLANPTKYKDFAHKTLETILSSCDVKHPFNKKTKAYIHKTLEDKLEDLYE